MKFKFLDNYSQQDVLKMFYTCGAVIFLIVGVANTYTNFVNWDLFMLSAKVSALFMNIFNYVLAVFFFLLRKELTKKPEKMKEETIEEIFKEAEKSEKK